MVLFMSSIFSFSRCWSGGKRGKDGRAEALGAGETVVSGGAYRGVVGVFFGIGIRIGIVASMVFE